MRKRWKRLRPYLSVFRMRALMETQYRAAAIGGMVTQAGFGLIYVFLYTALYTQSGQSGLEDTITYVWLQQALFRLQFSSGEITGLIRSGNLSYELVRPVDQHAYWACRETATRVVAVLMRAVPMLLFQLLLPPEFRMSLPESPLALGQFLLSLCLGIFFLVQLSAVTDAIVMKTLDNKGIAGMISLLHVTFSGNVVPLTLFPDSVQSFIRMQPFAQALDAPIRMYTHAQPLLEWLGSLGVQAFWGLALLLLGRWLWRRRLNALTIQGG